MSLCKSSCLLGGTVGRGGVCGMSGKVCSSRGSGFAGCRITVGGCPTSFLIRSATLCILNFVSRRPRIVRLKATEGTLEVASGSVGRRFCDSFSERSVRNRCTRRVLSGGGLGRGILGGNGVVHVLGFGTLICSLVEGGSSCSSSRLVKVLAQVRGYECLGKFRC